MFLRSCAMALATLVLAGCATDHDGYYDTYPAYRYGPYYGSGYGYSHFYDFDDDDDRYFRPKRNVICDRKRDVCYDRSGLNHAATEKYFGDRDADQARKRYNDSELLFSPREGVTCNRRTETCSRRQWTERIFGDESSRPRQLEPRNLRPDRDDRTADNVMPRSLRERLDDDGDLRRLPPPRVQRDDTDRPRLRPRTGDNDQLILPRRAGDRNK